MNIQNIKNQFTIFKNNPELVYLDNAATTQKPKNVVDALVNFYENHNANVHRGLYPLSEKATKMYEEARQTIAKFINADPKEIIFVSGATEALNGIATSLQNSGIVDGTSKVVLTDLEHHSNTLPWQNLKPEVMQYLPLNENFQVNYGGIMKDADIFATTHVSNVTGTIVPIEEIIKENSYPYSIIDATQSVAHMKIDVKKMGVDFLTFSGHKMYGPTGIGVLYAKKEILEQIEPFKFGGGMISEVKRDEATWAPLPDKFEAGTPNVADAIALAEAVRFLEEVGSDEIEKHEQELRAYLYKKLSEIEGLKIYHPNLETKALAVFSFTVEGVHPHDIAQFIGESEICVRAGHHCTQILHKEVLEIPASVRVSLAIYNTAQDIDKFIEKLKETIRIYKK